ncbi:MAG: hypothetical protein AB8G96_16250 [Phycisphaerales bacterium]
MIDRVRRLSRRPARRLASRGSAFCGTAARGAVSAGLGLALVASAASLGGCAPWATYPKVERSVTIAEPRVAPLPELMARAVAVAYALEHEEYAEAEKLPPTPFNLPVGTPLSVWETVAGRLGQAFPATEVAPEVIHVEQIRLRGTEAQVDVIRRPRGGTPVLTTITFRRELLRGWFVERTRDWRIPTDVPELGYAGALADATERRRRNSENDLNIDLTDPVQPLPRGHSG